MTREEKIEKILREKKLLNLEENFSWKDHS